MPSDLLTKNACIYSNNRRRLSARLLRELPTVTDASDNGSLFRVPTIFTFSVGSTQVKLNAQYSSEALTEHLRGFHGWVDSMHAIRPILNLEVFHQFLDQVNQSYGVVVDEEFGLDSAAMKAIVSIADVLEGMVFIHNSVLDGDGSVLFGLLAEAHDTSDGETT